MTSYLVTGGTGSFGQAFTRHLLNQPDTDKVIVFSRDELKQHEMRTSGRYDDQRIRFFIGDVRDRDRLRRAMRAIDVVVHAAALKQVDTCEYNPLEAIRTNVDGTANVIEAALDTRVGKVLLLGTDKAVDPVNLYGASKLAAEKLIVDANAYAGSGGTRFAATRYGNVLASRGSVLPVFQAAHREGRHLPVTDPAMTRFVLTLDQGVEFVSDCLEVMTGGEVFVPKLPAVTVETMCAAVTWPETPRLSVRGLRPGEKRHELLVSVNESPRVLDRGWHYLVAPIRPWHDDAWDGHPVPAGFRFGSDTARQLTVAELRELAGLDRDLKAAI